MKEAGIIDIGIIVISKDSDIVDFVGDGSEWGFNITYIEQPEPLGLAHAVLTAEEYIGDDNFVMYLGDNIIKEGFKDLVKEFVKNKPNTQILLAHVRDPERFGVAELKNGKISRLLEKPEIPPSDLALVGVYMFDSNIFHAAKNIMPSARGELEITDAIQFMIDNGHVVVPYVINGWWKDTGKLDDLLEANRIILDDLNTEMNGEMDDESRLIGKVSIGKGTHITKSTIRGPAIIGNNVIIKNSYIGPFTSIYHNSQIINSEVEHSIILDAVKLLNIPIRIEDSLLGRNVEIIKSRIKPKTYKFMVGDNSRIDII